MEQETTTVKEKSSGMGTDSGTGWELSPNSIPDDIALNIAALLEGGDVCALGCCSRFWSHICASTSLWIHLSNNRWPHLQFQLGFNSYTSTSSPSPFINHHPHPQPQGWKGFYISKHNSLARGASIVTKFVEECTSNGSLEVAHYLKAINDLRSLKLGFKDVQLFLLARKHGVLLNLIGLHYSIVSLGAPPKDVIEALRMCQVAEREVCVSWFKLGRWFYGYRLPDKHQSRKVSLHELAMTQGEEVLRVLNRGAVHEVFRVQITSVNVRPMPTVTRR